MHRQSAVILLVFALGSLILPGCVTMRDPEASFEYSGDVVATLTSETRVGQTFVSRRPGLNGVQLWLRISSREIQDTDSLTVSLFHSPGETKPLATAPVAYSRVVGAFPVTIPFPVLTDPPGQVYYLQLETQGSPISIYGRGEDAYPDGSLFVEDVAQASDLAFRTSYSYGPKAVLGDLGRVLRGSWLVLPLILLLWAPGMLILELAGVVQRPKFLRVFAPSWSASFSGEGKGLLSTWDWGERTALAVGLSLAITPIVLLWTTVLGLHWSRWGALAAAGLAALGLIGLRVLRIRRGERLPPLDWIDLGLLAIMLLTLGVRLAMARDLAAPAWVDPVHHATIVRLIAEHGAYPQSYDPYVAANTASYHPGFHGLVAVFGWLSGLGLAQSMLLLGQVLNALIVPAVYLLAVVLTRDRLAGLIAGLAVGFLTPMPAYYTSWGRYTQLAGLLILPACAALLIKLLEGQVFPQARAELVAPPNSKVTATTGISDTAYTDPDSLPVGAQLTIAPGNPGEAPERSPQIRSLQGRSFPNGLIDSLMLAGLASLACAGLFLVHYRVAGFLAFLMIAYGLGELLRSLDKRPLWKTLPSAAGWIALSALLAVLVSLPWWPELLQTMLLPRLATARPPPVPLKIDWGYLTPVFGGQILWLAAAGLLISVLRARWFGPVLALWVGLLFMSANQGIVRILGAGMINITSVEIMLFLPVVILAGYAASFGLRLIDRLIPKWGKTAAYVALSIGVCAAAYAGAQKLLPILNPVTLLFREADRPAIEWIAANLPADETILINPFLWGYGYYAGQDGGYWITPLSGRKTMPPNLLYAMGSRPQVERVNRISQKTLDLAGDPPALHALLVEEDIRYIYLGRRGGALSASKLVSSGLFEVLYNFEGTWVFEVQ
jgi:hypothetical protein